MDFSIELLVILGWVVLVLIWVITDPRPLKIRLREYLKPVPLTYILSLLLFILGHKFGGPLFGWPATRFDGLTVAIGLFLYLVGASIAVWAKLAMKANWGMPGQHDIKVQKELITRGPFTFSRHPIYLGLVVMTLGFSLTFRSLLIFAVVLISIHFQRAAVKEEKLLAKYFGKSYRDYEKKVPRFIFYK